MKQLLNNSWFANILFLLVVAGGNYLLNMLSDPRPQPAYLLYSELWVMLAYGMAVVHNMYILKLLTEKRKYWQYALLIVAWLAVTTTLTYCLRIYIFKINVHPDALFEELAFAVVWLLVGVGIWFLYRQATAQTRELRMSLLLREKELQYLQSQLNPHFFFNTLNNLYGVSLRFPKKTPELILSISELVRYQLESSQKQQVPLEEELQFIRNYIYLERARIRQRCQVSFRKKGSEEGLLIAPLILIAFIENAFKYAPSSIQASFIKVELSIRLNVLTLKVSNKVPENTEKVSSSGVGLKNVKQRLLLMYPNKHLLNTYEKNSIYYVELQLTLHHANIPLSDSGR